MMTDKIFDFVVNSVRTEERQKQREIDRANEKTEPICKERFWLDREAGTLIESCKKKAERHREREKHYITKLEEAEKDLKENGVSIEAYDQMAGIYVPHVSGSICSGTIQNRGTNFQPRVDQRLVDNVNSAKSKMLEHREKAVQYEKYARAFALDPKRLIRLTVEDVTYFGLEG